jgi:hypothetical protein
MDALLVAVLVGGGVGAVLAHGQAVDGGSFEAQAPLASRHAPHLLRIVARMALALKRGGLEAACAADLRSVVEACEALAGLLASAAPNPDAGPRAFQLRGYLLHTLQGMVDKARHAPWRGEPWEDLGTGVTYLLHTLAGELTEAFGATCKQVAKQNEVKR